MTDDLKYTVSQWLAKADIDWATVEILSIHPKGPIPANCQQYVEKLLKALLTLNQIEAPRTHDLRYLIQLATPTVPSLASLADRADALSTHGVDIRYPDDRRIVSETELQEMLVLTDEFAMILLPILKDCQK